ncbi:LmbU family transcriptional regulator [Amycolatopsis magusensis]|uniref:LmbU family transcriptional regulator n=1 Tax=Amycolatopsis magusensis TaxID=882444 RepID=UPI0024A87F9D|nr:LmbU family transcriptional regulator [Amycolatopsis magusensis]MDI5980593.1 LmbU family transcriptional regulator [Amycolatopsis magusensis]
MHAHRTTVTEDRRPINGNNVEPHGDRGRPKFLPPSTRTKQTGLIIPGDVSVDEWREIGNHIIVIANSSAWWLGDWLIYGQDHYPDRYKRAVEETSLDYQTLRNYAWIARRYPLHRRHAKLSFQHHAELASLPDEQQDEWLSRAEKSGWSRNVLRTKVRAAKNVGNGTEKAPKLNMRVAPEQRRRWQEAAAAADQDLLSWMMLVLDSAASSTLDPAWDDADGND